MQRMVKLLCKRIRLFRFCLLLTGGAIVMLAAGHLRFTKTSNESYMYKLPENFFKRTLEVLNAQQRRFLIPTEDDCVSNIMTDYLAGSNGFTPHPGYIRVGVLPVFLFSAVGTNTSGNASWDNFAVIGWEGKQYINTSYTCCFHYEDHVKTTQVVEKHGFCCLEYSKLAAKQFICPDPYKTDIRPVGVTLVENTSACPKFITDYIRVTLPLKQQEPRFAICSKVVYGNKDAQQLIEWFETQRLYGVRKVIVYPYLKSLQPLALKVLRHYEQKGLAEMIPFYDVPMNDTNSRAFGKGWGFDMYNDEQVTLFDCQERLRGYKYAAFIDLDEYITPVVDPSFSYLQLMDYLFSKFPSASGFTFKDHMHILTWGKTHPDADLAIIQYANHTVPLHDTPKNVVRLDRVLPGTLWTHEHKPVQGYNWFAVATDIGVIHHYAVCRDSWLRDKSSLPNKCISGFKRFPGTTMFDIANKIKSKVMSVKRSLEIL